MKQLMMATVAALVLASCGGSSSGPSTPLVPLLPGGGGGTAQPTFQPGVFPPSADYRDQCAVVRTGRDIDGNRWPDQQGTDLEERYWLRSWSDELYLWYDEITDTDPATYATKYDHFDALRTTRTTRSGADVDRFHFWYDTDEYEQLTAGGPEVGYGVQFAVLETRVPRDVRVAYVFDEGAAGGPVDGLARGLEILRVDGVDLVNDETQGGVDIINAGLFPETAGETHTFTVFDPATETTRDIAVSAEEVAEPPVLRTRTFDMERDGETVVAGYVMLNTFGNREAEGALIDAFRDLRDAGVEELFVDLRYNGGGFLDVSAELGYMIAGGARTQGRDFNNLNFSDKHPRINPVTGRTLSPTPFHARSQGFDPDVADGTQLPTLGLDRVSVLSTARTCSASEALVNGLLGVGVDVELVGGTTCGKPYGFYGFDNCGTTWFSIQFQGTNDVDFGDFGDGFRPVAGTSSRDEVEGCAVADDFGSALGDLDEGLLSAAVAKRATGVCPVADVAQGPGTTAKVVRRGPAIADTPRLRARETLRTSTILSVEEGLDDR